MKLTAQQTMRLQNVTAADNDYRRAKIDARAVGKKAEEDYIARFMFERDRAVRLAVEEGVPKNQLLQQDQGLHTTAGVTLKNALERTADLVATMEKEQTDPHAARYSLFEDDTHGTAIRVTLTPTELEDAARAVNYDEKDAGAAPATAAFLVTPRGRLEAIDGLTVGDTYERNPVVAWAYDHESEALAWLAEQTAGVAA